MEEKILIGYMRVSSREQNEDRQRVALLEIGVPEEKGSDIVVLDMPLLDTGREKFHKVYLQKSALFMT